MRRTQISAIALSLLFLAFFAGPVLAQVTVTMQNGQITINNDGFDLQDSFQSTSKSGSGSDWMVEDNNGNAYQAGDGSIPPIIIADYGYYQDHEEGHPPPPPPPCPGCYQGIYVALAIQQSITDGADVINLSLRMAYSPVIEEAVNDALDAGITVVIAAGNYDPAEQNKVVAFPANIDGVIAVAAGDASLQYIDSSADQGVDIIAPGLNILVVKSDDNWHEATGTSFAAPHVAATVALLLAVDSTLTPAQVLTALKDGADMSGNTGTVGFLHAGGALNEVVSPVTWSNEDFPHEVCGSSKRGPVAASTPTTEPSELPALTGNYPNPFNPETTISFQLPVNQQVRLAVYNVLGQQVQLLVDGYMTSGRHEARFRANELPSGTYFTRLETEAGVFTKSMLLMK